jgi:dienelactone hydrolase
VTLRTDDERTVHAVWVEHPSSRAREGSARGAAFEPESAPACETPAVLLLHANAMVLDDMAEWANYYLGLGCSVLMVTFWSYPDPTEEYEEEEASPTMPEGGSGDQPMASLLNAHAEQREHGPKMPTETSVDLDGEAALKFVLQTRRVPVERVLAHGLSMGGACAASLGIRHPGLRVTFDQVFASLAEVSLHFGHGIYEGNVLPRAPRSCHRLLRLLQPAIMRAAVFVFVRMVFKMDERHARHHCKLDRMDNVAKAGRIQGDLFAIFAEHDEMMPPTVAQRLVTARYGGGPAREEFRRSRIAGVPGGHCCFFGDVPELAHKYAAYLVQSGFLPGPLEGM